jgi:hypothetical protein
MSDEKIFIVIDDERIELTGAEKEAFLADRKARADYQAQIEAEAQAKAAAKTAAQAKLAALGLSVDELQALGF